jgi:hypothetical protein
MNKRITELAKQAGLKQTKWADAETGVEPVRIWQESLNDPGALERFAELIVKDCCDLLVKQGDEWLEFAKNPPKDYGHHSSNALFTAFRLKEDAVDNLKEHFGVSTDE